MNQTASTSVDKYKKALFLIDSFQRHTIASLDELHASHLEQGEKQFLMFGMFYLKLEFSKKTVSR